MPYWIFANTWGRDWGEGGNRLIISLSFFVGFLLVLLLDSVVLTFTGFFRVLRDFDSYNFPYNDAVAGIPAKLHRG